MKVLDVFVDSDGMNFKLGAENNMEKAVLKTVADQDYYSCAMDEDTSEDGCVATLIIMIPIPGKAVE